MPMVKWLTKIEIVNSIIMRIVHKDNLRKFIYNAPKRYELSQNLFELYECAKIINKAKPKNILEIGSHFGGTFKVWCMCSQNNGKQVSISWHPSSSDCYTQYQSEQKRSEAHDNIMSCGKNVYHIDADSHLKSTKNELTSILGDEKLDFIFIDGDHTYEGVKKDYEMYYTLMKKGGIIGFHDLVDKKFGVYKLWNQIKNNRKQRKIIDYGSQLGIGLLWV